MPKKWYNYIVSVDDPIGAETSAPNAPGVRLVEWIGS